MPGRFPCWVSFTRLRLPFINRDTFVDKNLASVEFVFWFYNVTLRMHLPEDADAIGISFAAKFDIWQFSVLRVVFRLPCSCQFRRFVFRSRENTSEKRTSNLAVQGLVQS